MFEDRDGDYECADNEPPLPDVTVRLYDLGQVVVLGEAITDESGRFTMGELQPGLYVLAPLPTPGWEFRVVSRYAMVTGGQTSYGHNFPARRLPTATPTPTSTPTPMRVYLPLWRLGQAGF